MNTLNSRLIMNPNKAEKETLSLAYWKWNTYTFLNWDNVDSILIISILNLSNSCSSTTIVGVILISNDLRTLATSYTGGSLRRMSLATESITSSLLTPPSTVPTVQAFIQVRKPFIMYKLSMFVVIPGMVIVGPIVCIGDDFWQKIVVCTYR